VLAARGVEFPFIHDISGLAKLCREAGAPLPVAAQASCEYEVLL
jgi:hypothetical protein